MDRYSDSVSKYKNCKLLEDVAVFQVSQCFVQALVIRTKEVTNDVRYQLEQASGDDKYIAANIEEAFKKRLNHFIADYVFL